METGDYKLLNISEKDTNLSKTTEINEKSCENIQNEEISTASPTIKKRGRARKITTTIKMNSEEKSDSSEIAFNHNEIEDPSPSDNSISQSNIRTYSNRRKTNSLQSQSTEQQKSQIQTSLQSQLQTQSDLQSQISLDQQKHEENPINQMVGNECRRSQRKKIMKYDVRDLFKTNRSTKKQEQSFEKQQTLSSSVTYQNNEINNLIDLSDRSNSSISSPQIFKGFSSPIIFNASSSDSSTLTSIIPNSIATTATTTPINSLSSIKEQKNEINVQTNKPSTSPRKKISEIFKKVKPTKKTTTTEGAKRGRKKKVVTQQENVNLAGNNSSDISSETSNTNTISVEKEVTLENTKLKLSQDDINITKSTFKPCTLRKTRSKTICEELPDEKEINLTLNRTLRRQKKTKLDENISESASKSIDTSQILKMQSPKSINDIIVDQNYENTSTNTLKEEKKSQSPIDDDNSLKDDIANFIEKSENLLKENYSIVDHDKAENSYFSVKEDQQSSIIILSDDDDSNDNNGNNTSTTHHETDSAISIDGATSIEVETFSEYSLLTYSSAASSPVRNMSTEFISKNESNDNTTQLNSSTENLKDKSDKLASKQINIEELSPSSLKKQISLPEITTVIDGKSILVEPVVIEDESKIIEKISTPIESNKIEEDKSIQKGIIEEKSSLKTSILNKEKSTQEISTNIDIKTPEKLTKNENNASFSIENFLKSDLTTIKNTKKIKKSKNIIIDTKISPPSVKDKNKKLKKLSKSNESDINKKESKKKEKKIKITSNSKDKLNKIENNETQDESFVEKKSSPEKKIKKQNRKDSKKCSSTSIINPLDKSPLSKKIKEKGKNSKNLSPSTSLTQLPTKSMSDYVNKLTTPVESYKVLTSTPKEKCTNVSIIKRRDSIDIFKQKNSSNNKKKDKISLPSFTPIKTKGSKNDDSVEEKLQKNQINETKIKKCIQQDNIDSASQNDHKEQKETEKIIEKDQCQNDNAVQVIDKGYPLTNDVIRNNDDDEVNINATEQKVNEIIAENLDISEKDIIILSSSKDINNQSERSTTPPILETIKTEEITSIENIKSPETTKIKSENECNLDNRKLISFSNDSRYDEFAKKLSIIAATTELKKIKTKNNKKSKEKQLKNTEKIKKQIKKLEMSFTKDPITNTLANQIYNEAQTNMNTLGSYNESFAPPPFQSKAALKDYSFQECKPTELSDTSSSSANSTSLCSIKDECDPSATDNTNSSIRRSDRIKTISQAKSQQYSVGIGLVKDKSWIQLNDDERQLLINTLGDSTAQQSINYATESTVFQMDYEKLAKDMEEALCLFQIIKENEYRCKRIISEEAKRMMCDCFMTREEEERGEFGCGEDCLNRLLMIECSRKCIVGDRCTNRRFQRLKHSPCRVFKTDKKGFGLMADTEILPGQFIMEYVGEVLNTKQFEKRANIYSQDNNKHYYFMALRSDAIIDATQKGNISRFINHSCDPNAETQKWTVNGELRIGFFSTKHILPGEEITFDYQFQRYGREAQKCYCEAANCRGWIGEEPDSDDEEEEYEEVEEDEEIESDEEIKKDQVAEIHMKEISDEKEHEDNKENATATETPVIIEEKEKRIKKVKKLKKKKKAEYNLLGMNIADVDLDKEITSLERSGLKNQVHTLCLSRLMVRAKIFDSRMRLLDILRKGESPCIRLFLDYHGLHLLHGWMIEASDLNDPYRENEYRHRLVQTLEILPIQNKTTLKDSKVFQTVETWIKELKHKHNLPSTTLPLDEKQIQLNKEIIEISMKLIDIWENLPEVFRIPKRERIEQMKEHEREADRLYNTLNLQIEEDNENLQRQRNNERFGAPRKTRVDEKKLHRHSLPNDHHHHHHHGHHNISITSNISNKIVIGKDTEKIDLPCDASLSKETRRKLFEEKVAQVEAEKRLTEQRREIENKIKCFGFENTMMLSEDIPFCVDPFTGQWYSQRSLPVATPPAYEYYQPAFDPDNYELPEMNLPPFWKFAIDAEGRIYYYHIKFRIPQWEPPTKPENSNDQTETNESNIKNDDDSENVSSESEIDVENSNDKNKNSTTENDNNDEEISKQKVKCSKTDLEKAEVLERKKERYNKLVQQRPISPRREEDRIHNQIEARKYKENKEKIRRRKEEIKKRKAELLKKQSEKSETETIVTSTVENNGTTIINVPIEKDQEENIDLLQPLPIQDYLISSEEDNDKDDDIDDNHLINNKFVKGDKIVDELDALKIKKSLKRSLPILDKSLLDEKKKFKLIDENDEKLNDDVVKSVIFGKKSLSKQRKENNTQQKVTLNTDDDVVTSTTVSISPSMVINSTATTISSSLSSSTSRNSSKCKSSQARKAREKFRYDISSVIVHHLQSYRKNSCSIGRITNEEDFKHLARKLTHFVMVKELKHCDSTGHQLIVTESVKIKAREFIKKYMAKYGETYIRPDNDPEFKEIPH